MKTLLIIALLTAMGIQTPSKPADAPVITPDQQAEFQQAQRNVIDAQKALDLAVSQRATVIYKIRSELAAPEKKFTVKMVEGLLVFDIVPEPKPTPK